MFIDFDGPGEDVRACSVTPEYAGCRVVHFIRVQNYEVKDDPCTGDSTYNRTPSGVEGYHVICNKQR